MGRDQNMQFWTQSRNLSKSVKIKAKNVGICQNLSYKVGRYIKIWKFKQKVGICQKLFKLKHMLESIRTKIWVQLGENWSKS